MLIFIEISLKCVPNGPIDNKSALVQIMAWCRTGDKPLSEPMMVIGDSFQNHHISQYRGHHLKMVVSLSPKFSKKHSEMPYFRSDRWPFYCYFLLLLYQFVIRNNKLFWSWIWMYYSFQRKRRCIEDVKWLTMYITSNENISVNRRAYKMRRTILGSIY